MNAPRHFTERVAKPGAIIVKVDYPFAIERLDDTYRVIDGRTDALVKETDSLSSAAGTLGMEAKRVRQAAKTRRRPCIRCTKTFFSEGSHHRTCDTCRHI